MREGSARHPRAGKAQPSVTVRAPAKINLQLAVGAPGPDGYHPLATVFHAVGLYDELTATPADGGGVQITVEADGPVGIDQVPLDGTNLAVRAATLLAARTGVTPDVQLHVRKGIPVAGGMAGGSADAAAAVVACDLLWRTGLAREDLHALGAELGADVPFALMGGTAIGTGRGDVLTPALARGDFHWVLAGSDRGLSTPAVYAECDRLRDGRPVLEPRVSDQMMQALRSGRPASVGAALANDLQPAALSLRPSLRRTLDIGVEYSALGGVVSGSGPTVAFLVADADRALDLAVALSASGTCQSVHRVSGPVHGVRSVDPPRLR
jgi:4-diphosphocytidyl-2-C-methyl-D-erythritol kinase